ncbi:hypothetical protein AVDCRST_MAG92-2870 [uncultured Coleofasciculus sp.]|uniref:Uncharacterized protein n=1 Tax=uncultured Coleofasciculus sp. TaxID=1267456 RepID=A0A6J4J4S0_9CYAN|nr:hypothetical protein AVDCRST_MAG92-2870 [uncultured Coleofasciculus sp.]
MLVLVRPWKKTRYRYYYIFVANSICNVNRSLLPGGFSL